MSELGVPQSCIDAAAAIEGVAQELDGLGRTASAKMLRHALDVILGVEPDAPLSPADEATHAAVSRAYDRFIGAVRADAASAIARKLSTAPFIGLPLGNGEWI